MLFQKCDFVTAEFLYILQGKVESFALVIESLDIDSIFSLVDSCDFCVISVHNETRKRLLEIIVTIKKSDDGILHNPIFVCIDVFEGL